MGTHDAAAGLSDDPAIETKVNASQDQAGNENGVALHRQAFDSSVALEQPSVIEVPAPILKESEGPVFYVFEGKADDSSAESELVKPTPAMVEAEVGSIESEGGVPNEKSEVEVETVDVESEKVVVGSQDVPALSSSENLALEVDCGKVDEPFSDGSSQDVTVNSAPANEIALSCKDAEEQVSAAAPLEIGLGESPADDLNTLEESAKTEESSVSEVEVPLSSTEVKDAGESAMGQEVPAVSIQDELELVDMTPAKEDPAATPAGGEVLYDTVVADNRTEILSDIVVADNPVEDAQVDHVTVQDVGSPADAEAVSQTVERHQEIPQDVDVTNEASDLSESLAFGVKEHVTDVSGVGSPLEDGASSQSEVIDKSDDLTSSLVEETVVDVKDDSANIVPEEEVIIERASSEDLMVQSSHEEAREEPEGLSNAVVPQEAVDDEVQQVNVEGEEPAVQGTPQDGNVQQDNVKFKELTDIAAAENTLLVSRDVPVEFDEVPEVTVMADEHVEAGSREVDVSNQGSVEPEVTVVSEEPSEDLAENPSVEVLLDGASSQKGAPEEVVDISGDPDKEVFIQGESEPVAYEEEAVVEAGHEENGIVAAEESNAMVRAPERTVDDEVKKVECEEATDNPSAVEDTNQDGKATAVEEGSAVVMVSSEVPDVDEALDVPVEAEVPTRSEESVVTLKVPVGTQTSVSEVDQAEVLLGENTESNASDSANVFPGEELSTQNQPEQETVAEPQAHAIVSEVSVVDGENQPEDKEEGTVTVISTVEEPITEDFSEAVPDDEAVPDFTEKETVVSEKETVVSETVALKETEKSLVEADHSCSTEGTGCDAGGENGSSTVESNTTSEELPIEADAQDTVAEVSLTEGEQQVSLADGESQPGAEEASENTSQRDISIVEEATSDDVNVAAFVPDFKEKEVTLETVVPEELEKSLVEADHSRTDGTTSNDDEIHLGSRTVSSTNSTELPIEAEAKAKAVIAEVNVAESQEDAVDAVAGSLAEGEEQVYGENQPEPALGKTQTDISRVQEPTTEDVNVAVSENDVVPDFREKSVVEADHSSSTTSNDTEVHLGGESGPSISTNNSELSVEAEAAAVEDAEDTVADVPYEEQVSVFEGENQPKALSDVGPEQALEETQTDISTVEEPTTEDVNVAVLKEDFTEKEAVISETVAPEEAEKSLVEASSTEGTTPREIHLGGENGPSTVDSSTNSEEVHIEAEADAETITEVNLSEPQDAVAEVTLPEAAEQAKVATDAVAEEVTEVAISHEEIPAVEELKDVVDVVEDETFAVHNVTEKEAVVSETTVDKDTEKSELDADHLSLTAEAAKVDRQFVILESAAPEEIEDSVPDTNSAEEDAVAEVPLPEAEAKVATDAVAEEVTEVAMSQEEIPAVEGLKNVVDVVEDETLAVPSVTEEEAVVWETTVQDTELDADHLSSTAEAAEVDRQFVILETAAPEEIENSVPANSAEANDAEVHLGGGNYDSTEAESEAVTVDDTVDAEIQHDLDAEVSVAEEKPEAILAEEVASSQEDLVPNEDAIFADLKCLEPQGTAEPAPKDADESGNIVPVEELPIQTEPKDVTAEDTVAESHEDAHVQEQLEPSSRVEASGEVIAQEKVPTVGQSNVIDSFSDVKSDAAEKEAVILESESAEGVTTEDTVAKSQEDALDVGTPLQGQLEGITQQDVMEDATDSVHEETSDPSAAAVVLEREPEDAPDSTSPEETKEVVIDSTEGSGSLASPVLAATSDREVEDTVAIEHGSQVVDTLVEEVETQEILQDSIKQEVEMVDPKVLGNNEDSLPEAPTEEQARDILPESADSFKEELEVGVEKVGTHLKQEDVGIAAETEEITDEKEAPIEEIIETVPAEEEAEVPHDREAVSAQEEALASAVPESHVVEASEEEFRDKEISLLVTAEGDASEVNDVAVISSKVPEPVAEELTEEIVENLSKLQPGVNAENIGDVEPSVHEELSAEEGACAIAKEVAEQVFQEDQAGKSETEVVPAESSAPDHAEAEVVDTTVDLKGKEEEDDRVHTEQVEQLDIAAEEIFQRVPDEAVNASMKGDQTTREVVLDERDLKQDEEVAQVETYPDIADQVLKEPVIETSDEVDAVLVSEVGRSNTEEYVVDEVVTVINEASHEAEQMPVDDNLSSVAVAEDEVNIKAKHPTEGTLVADLTHEAEQVQVDVPPTNEAPESATENVPEVEHEQVPEETIPVVETIYAVEVEETQAPANDTSNDIAEDNTTSEPAADLVTQVVLTPEDGGNVVVQETKQAPGGGEGSYPELFDSGEVAQVNETAMDRVATVADDVVTEESVQEEHTEVEAKDDLEKFSVEKGTSLETTGIQSKVNETEATSGIDCIQEQADDQTKVPESEEPLHLTSSQVLSEDPVVVQDGEGTKIISREFVVAEQDAEEIPADPYHFEAKETDENVQETSLDIEEGDPASGIQQCKASVLDPQEGTTSMANDLAEPLTRGDVPDAVQIPDESKETIEPAQTDELTIPTPVPCLVEDTFISAGVKGQSEDETATVRKDDKQDALDDAKQVPTKSPEEQDTELPAGQEVKSIQFQPMMVKTDEDQPQNVQKAVTREVEVVNDLSKSSDDDKDESPPAGEGGGVGAFVGAAIKSVLTSAMGLVKTTKPSKKKRMKLKKQMEAQQPSQALP